MTRTFGQRLGEILISQGSLTGTRLARALAEQRRFGGRLGGTLVACGYVSPDDLHAALARQIKLQLGAGKVPSAWRTMPYRRLATAA